MDFVLIGFILVLAFLFAVISPHPEVKHHKKHEVAPRPEQLAGDHLPSAPSEREKPASHPTTGAA